MEVTLYSAAGESKGQIELPKGLFERESAMRTLQEVIRAYQANQRRGTSNTKTRAEVSGGGRKPWRQKGTGNARSGSNRSPLWRKGGIVFGPRPRSYRIDVPEVKRRSALATALGLKAQNQEVAVLESMPEGDGKTSATGKFFSKTAPSGRVLVLVDKQTDLLRRAVKNLGRISIVEVRELNPWMLMHTQKLLLTQASLEALGNRLSPEKPAPAPAASAAKRKAKGSL